MTKLLAGKDIDSYCTKCKLDLGHLIVAMVGDTIAKVKCNTCGGVHNYREVNRTPKTATAKKTTAPKTIKEIPKSPEVLWEGRIAKARGVEIPYGMGKSFKLGDLISHDLFGKGVVLQVASKKCSVIFKDKERMLVTAN